MREDLEQQEQLEAIKGFWKDYRRLILGILVAAVLAFAGVWGWQSWQTSRADASGLLYESLEQALDAQDFEKAEAAYAQVRADYRGTTHADLSALRMAKAYVAAAKLDQAAEALRLAAESKDEALGWVAKTRLAAVLIDQDQLQEALKVLEGSPPTALEGMVQDRRGDVLVLLGRKDEARQAYLAARDRLQQDDAGRALEILQRKLGALDALSDALASPASPAANAPASSAK